MVGFTPRAAIVTGSGGLIGSEAVRRLVQEGFRVVGVDNNMRRHFFGEAGSTDPISKRLADEYGQFSWRRIDIRDEHRIFDLWREVRPEIVIHCAAQPSHDWSYRDPRTDFGVNAVGTLNVLEAHKRWTADSTFIHISTSKAYGDNPNRLPLVELETRYDLESDHEYYNGITRTMQLDGCIHSLFGVSKLSGDLLAQEYALNFGMPIGIFRPGCLTGGDHAGVELHGFLSYLGKCVAQGLKYKIFGYKGKQVRDNIHAQDLVSAFVEFHKRPTPGMVTNLGGGRTNSCSILEAIKLFDSLANQPLEGEYVEQARVGDHQWWIGSSQNFEELYPAWKLTRFLPDICQEIVEHFSV